MNYGMIRYVLGWIVALQSVFMLFPAVTGIVYGEGNATLIFLTCAAVCALIGFLMVRKRPEKTAFFAREGFIMVSLSWIVMALIGAVPFYVSGAIPSFVDALFETVSGFTTTGATILNDVEALPYSLLLWRSFTHWIGGMGVLVFMLAILPMAGGHSMYLMKAESPGPTVSKLVPNMRKTAMFLYGVYLVMTVTQFLLLITLGDMPVFDAICTAAGTAGTGGFGVKNDSLASYTVAAQMITTVFMLLFGVNFVAYFFILKKRFAAAFKLEEVRWYFGIYLIVSLLVFINVMVTTGGPIFDTLHHVFFQTASIMTTTGFSTLDYGSLWPQFSQMLILLLTCMGACAGSTGGGFKVSRVVMNLKNISGNLSQMLHPRRVKVLKMDGKPIESETISTLQSFVFVYILILMLSTIILAFDGFDMTTNLTAALTTLNNVGPGLGAVGPAGNFADFSAVSKLVCIFNMLAGRLEIFPLLLLLIPKTWKK